MKVKIKISYEWEKDVTESWKEYEAGGYSLEEFKKQEIEYDNAINRLDTSADNHILYDYKRNLEVTWENE